METLLDLVAEIERLGDTEACRWSNGLRTWTWTYRDIYRQLATFAQVLEQRGVGKGERILIWSENRPEWITAFWGAVARGVQVVPVDYRFSVDLVRLIAAEAKTRLLVHGSAVDAASIPLDRIAFDEVQPAVTTGLLKGAPLSRDDVVEIVYTSGTTGTPRGVVHRHRNICANLDPFRVEINKYKGWARPFQPIRMLNLLPLSHMFGQAMGLFIP